VLSREALGERRLATSSNKDVTAAERLDLASLAIASLNGKSLDGTGLLALGGDRENLVVVAHNMVKPRRAPAKVVLVFSTGREESAQVGKVNEATLTVEVVKESKLRSGVAKSGQILDEGDLHLGSREQHTGMPSELGLLLQEKDLGSCAIRAKLLALGDGIVNSDGYSQRCGAEASTDEVKLRIRRSGLEIRRSLLVNSGSMAGSRSSSVSVAVAVAVDMAVVAVSNTVGAICTVVTVGGTVGDRGLGAVE
jgi:hypothetical protein